MIILAYAGNKVEGMALAKVSALVMVGLIIPFVITDSTQYVFFISPFFLDSQVSDKQQLLVYSTSYLSFRGTSLPYYIIGIAQKYSFSQNC